MADEVPQQQPAPAVYGSRKRGDWDGVAAVVAALIGFLALLVSGYTAYIQRQQVRAQVWPYLIIGYADPDSAYIVFNKGVGPALVRGVQVLVDDQPQRGWGDALKALGFNDADRDKFEHSTIGNNVLSPGEKLEVVKVVKAADAELYERFRVAALKRMKFSVCYCSTLGECWVRDRRVRDQGIVQVDACPVWPVEQQFTD
jgi:hypothetical protein